MLSVELFELHLSFFQLNPHITESLDESEEPFEARCTVRSPPHVCTLSCTEIAKRRAEMACELQ